MILSQVQVTLKTSRAMEKKHIHCVYSLNLVFWMHVCLVVEGATVTLSSFYLSVPCSEETWYVVDVRDIYPNRNSVNGALSEMGWIKSS